MSDEVVERVAIAIKAARFRRTGRESLIATMDAPDENLLDDARAALSALHGEEMREKIARVVDPSAWVIDSDGHCVEQVHAANALAKADSIMALIGGGE